MADWIVRVHIIWCWMCSQLDIHRSMILRMSCKMDLWSCIFVLSILICHLALFDFMISFHSLWRYKLSSAYRSLFGWLKGNLYDFALHSKENNFILLLFSVVFCRIKRPNKHSFRTTNLTQHENVEYKSSWCKQQRLQQLWLHKWWNNTSHYSREAEYSRKYNN